MHPVLGGSLGTCFDAAVLPETAGYTMWFSWRDRGGIGRAVSQDGRNWTNIQLVFCGKLESTWRHEVNRPTVVRQKDRYLMWYTGQTATTAAIGIAESHDGIQWTDVQQSPVLSAAESWEASSVMCPNVVCLDDSGYQMWYSGGGQFEPKAIGYAQSKDGVHWQRIAAPVFTADGRFFDCARVAGSCVVPHNGEYLMFYIGFRSIEESGICLAKSPNGYAQWNRYPLNPILTPGNQSDAWDYDAVYRPTVLQEKDRWMLWYNGRRDALEQIGLAIHPGLNLGWA